MSGTGASPYAQNVDVIVLTTDPGLLATLQEAAGIEHTLWHAPSADAAVELLVGGRCGVLMADLQVLRGQAAALLERLQSQFPGLVCIVMGRREEESTVTALVSSGLIYRFLHKPVSPPRAGLFLATAARRYVELSHTSSPTMAAVRQFTQPSQRPKLLGILFGVLAAAVVLIWLGLQSDGSNEPAVASQQTQVAPAMTERLAAAAQAYTAGRLVAPPGDNALELYRAVLAAQPDNAAARAGVQQVITTLESEVVKAISVRDTPRAARAFSALQKADPAHPRIEALREQLLALSRSKRPG